MNNKKIHIFFHLAACFTLLITTLNGQTIKEFQEKVDSLPPSDKKAFYDSINKAGKLIQEKRVFDSVQALTTAEALVPNHPNVITAKASAHIELRDFKKALNIFHDLLKLYPDNSSVLFNIGEMHYVQAEWKEAIDYLNRALDGLYSSNSTELYNLSKFKIYICHKKLGNKAKTDKEEIAYDFTSDTPIYYFINCVKHYESGDKEEANRWIAKARRIFRSPNALSAWLDTLQEADYID